MTGADERLLKMHDAESIGNVTLNKETMFADSRGTGRSYYISVAKDAFYYVSVVTNGVIGKEYDVTIDNMSFMEGKVELGNGWQSLLIGP
jgi:hypothetical protein